MHTGGMISEFDPSGQYGLIDADDGALVLFNLSSIEPALRNTFAVGARVEFVEQSGPPAPRASALVLVSAGRSIDPS